MIISKVFKSWVIPPIIIVLSVMSFVFLSMCFVGAVTKHVTGDRIIHPHIINCSYNTLTIIRDDGTLQRVQIDEDKGNTCEDIFNPNIQEIVIYSEYFSNKSVVAVKVRPYGSFSMQPEKIIEKNKKRYYECTDEGGCVSRSSDAQVHGCDWFDISDPKNPNPKCLRSF